MEYFSNMNGKVIAITNCYQRHSNDDVIITSPLNTQQLEIYKEKKSDNLSDSHIFNLLYPRTTYIDQELDIPHGTKILIDIELLTKHQIIHLINNHLDCDLKSLSKMSHKDLCKLLKFFANTPVTS